MQVTTIRLVPHPGSPHPNIDVRVEIAREPGLLRVWFVVTGDLAVLRMPAAEKPARYDGLWNYTCFEVFLRGAAGESYCEFNVAPSRRWAAYQFDSYRQGMAYLREPEPISVSTQASHSVTVSVEIDLNELPMSPPLRLGLCAVIEDLKGGKSYWALRHPQGQPDFHHPDCFAIQLPAPSKA